MFQKKDKDVKKAEDVVLGYEEPLGEEETLLTASVKPAKKKLPGWVILPIIGGVCLVFFGISKVSGGAEKSPELAVVKVEKGDVKEIYTTSGTVESERTKVFFSPVNATVQLCNAKTGQSVKAGDLLIGYDVTDLQKNNQESQLNAQATQYTNQATVEESKRSAQAKAETEAQAATRIQNLQNQIAEKEINIAQLENQFAGAQTEAGFNASQAADLQIRMQDNQVKQSQLTVAKETAERELLNFEAAYPNLTEEQKKQKKEELVKSANEATAQIEALKLEYKTFEKQLSFVGSTDVSGLSQQIAAAQQELSGLRSSLADAQASATSSAPTGLTSGQLNGMQVSENLSELAVLKSEELVAKGQEGIKAEFDGIISDVKAAAGTAAVQGGELFTLVSNRDVSVKLQVSSNDFDSLKIGNTATVVLGGKEYKGTLTAIDKIALPNEKGTPVIGASIHIDNPDDGIYIGVSAKVKLNVAEKNNVVCLPNEVVNTSADGDFVYIIQNGTVKKQAVELGVASSSKVEITGGLKEGDKVISDATGTVAEGMKATAKETVVQSADGK